ncbi:SRPBCC family protein [Niabella drilacis]|uniref:Uncharacterized protein n=1 Tax=Niabella drilacis (strain DSM 25811 / CCM 8410 / CCUG 62505 / LMG 26954 / E90) TaxID=1285928 RepID=A0A1G6R4G8_NIADE|nr:hypothetical protein [Niabella drilacis]SDC99549.1 hypothetical protein SAMN04487894_105144 [Niabella drilacis]
MNKITFLRIAIILLLPGIWGPALMAQTVLRTRYFKIEVNDQGYITSMQNTTVKPYREFSPADKPSPLMMLYDAGQKKYYAPQKSVYTKKTKIFTLSYPNGSVARISVAPQPGYLKLQLLSLTNAGHIEAIQWGSYHTNITNLMGEVIGVARDTSAAVNYAIGMLALNDNTIGATADIEGDAAPFQYIIHTPDPQRFPLPDSLHEGQVFTLGGDGHNDVAFYAHKEPWYRILYGNAAGVDDKGRISIVYQSRDRKQEREVQYSLMPNMAVNKPNHLKVQALPGVDYIGSSIALWGSPDSTALMDVIRDIVLSEKLPYTTINGKWVKDPAAFVPDAMSSGNLNDSIIAYASRLGFKAISLYDQGFLRPNRGNEGYIDGKDFERKPIRLSTGNLSHKAFSQLAARQHLVIGRTTITNSLAPGTKDASPVPSDSIWYQQKRLLARDISAMDTLIYVNDPTYLNEIGSWQAHVKSLNIIRVGKELVHFLGVSDTKPYRLLNVTRGYWKTQAAAHKALDTLYKLQVTIGAGYDGLIPNMQLQDEIAKYYADICYVNGLGYYDFDGQEFLFNTGHGYYGAKRFFRKMFERAKEHGIADIRFTGATLSEGSWHYQSIWNVGGGKNLYDARTREWGSTTSQGKDLRDVTYANFFPVGMGGNFPITEKSTVEEYEHIQAVSVGIGSTYSMRLNQKDVEKCPQKEQIFSVIRTWEDARAANAFPRWVRTKLTDPAYSWRLEAGAGPDTWTLYQMVDGKKTQPVVLKRAKGY